MLSRFTKLTSLDGKHSVSPVHAEPMAAAPADSAQD